MRTLHRRAAAARPRRAVGARRRAIRLADTRRLGRLVGWRIPGVARVRRPTTSCSAPTRSPSSTRPSTTLVSGLCGRIWTLARDYPALDGAGRVRGLGRARHGPRRVRALGRAARRRRAELYSEARVQPVDTHARLRLKAIWALSRPVRAPGRRGAARAGGRAGARGRDLDCARNGAGLGARGAGRPATDRGRPPPARRGAGGGARPPGRAERAAARRCPRAGRRSSPTSRCP